MALGLFMMPVLALPIFNRNGVMMLSMHYVIMIAVYIAMAQSWNILSGLTGMFSLGHSTFYAIGGYALASGIYLFKLSPAVGVLIGIILSAVFGFVLGIISSRLTGFFFTMSTIALSQVARTFALQMPDITNGVNGISIMRPPIPCTVFFYTAIGLAMISTGFFVWMRRSRMGSLFVSIRENTQLARSLGVNIVKYKTIASVIASVMASVTGSFIAYYIQVVDPSYLNSSIANKIVMVTIIGGVGNAWGPVFGSVLILLEEVIRGTMGSNYAPLATALYGVILIFFILFKSDGIVSMNLKSSISLALKALKPFENTRKGD
jgi:branched-chain amino acid transport system permease protein